MLIFNSSEELTFLNTSQISFQINFHLSIDVKDSISVAACQELDFLKSGRAWQDHLTTTYEVMQRLMVIQRFLNSQIRQYAIKDM